VNDIPKIGTFGSEGRRQFLEKKLPLPVRPGRGKRQGGHVLHGGHFEREIKSEVAHIELKRDISKERGERKGTISREERASDSKKEN